MHLLSFMLLWQHKVLIMVFYLISSHLPILSCRLLPIEWISSATVDEIYEVHGNLIEDWTDPEVYCSNILVFEDILSILNTETSLDALISYLLKKKDCGEVFIDVQLTALIVVKNANFFHNTHIG